MQPFFWPFSPSNTRLLTSVIFFFLKAFVDDNMEPKMSLTGICETSTRNASFFCYVENRWYCLLFHIKFNLSFLYLFPTFSCIFYLMVAIGFDKIIFDKLEKSFLVNFLKLNFFFKACKYSNCLIDCRNISKIFDERPKESRTFVWSQCFDV